MSCKEFNLISKEKLQNFMRNHIYYWVKFHTILFSIPNMNMRGGKIKLNNYNLSRQPLKHSLQICKVANYKYEDLSYSINNLGQVTEHEHPSYVLEFQLSLVMHL